MKFCPICNEKDTPSEIVRLPGNNFDDWIECKQCGKYFYAKFLS